MDKFLDKLISEGYESIPSGILGVSLAAQRKSKRLYMLCVVDYDVFAETVTLSDIYDRICVSIGEDIAVVHMIACSKDINSVRKLCMSYNSFWLFNTETRKLIVYDKQPQDFMKMRSSLEVYLNTGSLEKSDVNKAQLEAHKEYKSNVVNFRRHKKYTDWRRFITLTNIIILANIIFFVVLEIMGDTESGNFMQQHGALTYYDIERNGDYYRFFTSMFMHFGAMHLLYNMFFIFCFGHYLENLFSRWFLLLVYLGGGLGGNVLEYFMKLTSNEYTVCAGASGAAYALMGGLIAAMIFDIRLRADLGRVLMFGIMYVIAGVMDETVAVWAHGGGAITGFLIVSIYYLIRKPGIKQRH